jgi:hypothetical protein
MSLTLYDLNESTDGSLTLARQVADSAEDETADPVLVAEAWKAVGWQTEVTDKEVEGQDPAKVTVLRTRPSPGLPWTYVALVTS